MTMGTMSLKALPIYSSKWCIVLQTDSYNLNFPIVIQTKSCQFPFDSYWNIRIVENLPISYWPPSCISLTVHIYSLAVVLGTDNIDFFLPLPVSWTVIPCDSSKSQINIIYGKPGEVNLIRINKIRKEV
jgi:hypothetical protein